MEGYIRLHRKILESNICPKGKFSRFEAWVYLLLMANHTDKKWNGIDIKRGQFLTSQKGLAKKWGWSLGYVNKFLNWLKSETRIEIKPTNKYTILEILNYDELQGRKSKSESKSEIKVKPKENQSETTNNNDNNENNVIRKILRIFQEATGKKIVSSKGFENNLSYWLDVYSEEQVYQAIRNIPLDSFWKDKMTPTILFRRKNPQGEDVDYIERLLNYQQNVSEKRKNDLDDFMIKISTEA